MKVLTRPTVTVQRLMEKDIEAVAEIASKSFSGMKELAGAAKWIRCNYAAYPRTQYFVARFRRKIVGYVLWIERGGFRQESVWELEQIVVRKALRGHGVARTLIKQSLELIKKQLHRRKSSLKLVLITTGSENSAYRLYEKALGAKLECVIEEIFHGDEAIMIARFDRPRE